MTYKLAFKRSAQKEWNKLGATLKEQFKKKLKERLKTPRVESDRVLGGSDIYKIKLRQSGYRLVYQVQDKILTVEVIAIGKRERNKAYKNALKRIDAD
jgi:mRNA interferase RelE/StbE